jgi:hypothetical protein
MNVAAEKFRRGSRCENIDAAVVSSARGGGLKPKP